MASAGNGYQVRLNVQSICRFCVYVLSGWQQISIYTGKRQCRLRTLQKAVHAISKFTTGSERGFFASVLTEALVRKWGSHIRSGKSECDNEYLWYFIQRSVSCIIRNAFQWAHSPTAIASDVSMAAYAVRFCTFPCDGEVL